MGKIGKKIKSTILIITALAVLFYAAVIFLHPGTIHYSLSEDGTYYVVKGISDGPFRKKEKVKIPETHEKLPVKGILRDAIRNEAVKSITLPKTLEGISDEAFVDTAYYNDEDSWEIIYDDEYGVELYRALYISNYLIEVRYNDRVVDADGALPKVVVKDGTLGIAEKAFKSTNPDAKYSTATVIIESDDLSFVGSGVVNDGDYYIDDYKRSKDMFGIECDSYVIGYDGLIADWNEFEAGPVTVEGAYLIHCQDGIIDLTSKP